MIKITSEIKKQILIFFNYYIFAVIEAGIGFFTIYYLTLNILPEEFGMIGIFASILFILPSILTFSTGGLQSIQIINLSNDNYLFFRNKFLSFSLIISFLVFLLTILFDYVISGYSVVFFSAYFVGLFQTLSLVHSSELIQYRKATTYGILTSSTSILTLIFTLVFILYLNLDWQFRLYAIVISEFVILIIRYYVISNIGKSFKFIIDYNQFRYFLSYGFPLILAGVLGWVLNQSDKYFILHYFDLKIVGLYTAAAGVAKVISMINQTMIKAILPVVYNLLKKKKGKRKILKLQIYYAIIILFISFTLCYLIHLFGSKLLDTRYLKAVNIIYIFVLAKAAFGIYTMNALIIDYFKKTKIKLLATFLCALITVVCTYLFIPIFQTLGPAFAGLAGFISLNLISLYFSNKLMKLNKII